MTGQRIGRGGRSDEARRDRRDEARQRRLFDLAHLSRGREEKLLSPREASLAADVRRNSISPGEASLAEVWKSAWLRVLHGATDSAKGST